MSTQRSRSMVTFVLVAGAAAALALASCSGVPGSAAGVAKKMLRAHGGSAAVKRLDCFVGRGFIRDLIEDTVARSYSFDVYRKGRLYKHKILAAPTGTLTDVIIISFDGTTSREWMNGKGTTTISPMELAMLDYRFPDVIAWVQGADRAGEILPMEKGSPVVRLRYKDASSIITLSVDRATWLLDSVQVASATDSAATFSERYEHYTDVEGIPFPQEFKATYKGRPYYDYVLSLIELKTDIPDSLFKVTAEDTSFTVKPPKTEAKSAPKR